MKRYRELTKSELAEIEIPARGVVSWRRRGILTRFSPVKDVAEKQTPGFPDYAPQMTEIVHLKDRWMPMEKSYRKLMATKPWKDMYSNRVKTLYFHERKKLTPVAIRLLDEHVAYMRKHARAFYEILHWFTMKTKPGRDEDGDDASLYDKSATLHLERSKRHEAVGRPFESRIAKLIERGLPATMVWEPGFWLYPTKVCHLYLMDPSGMTKGRGTLWKSRSNWRSAKNPAELNGLRTALTSIGWRMFRLRFAIWPSQSNNVQQIPSLRLALLSSKS
ncbi:Hypothetical protein PHPALM_8151 [Phytophthora palmivora]|uniref:Uncharacterized protein n=1 Tax=Phytophthora palmivora TaxID=4796 RepID=A0A2P4YAH8_9STRA|nr:Hypothetical protein PHPALM_8151 [Phytophthora palmivora]